MAIRDTEFDIIFETGSDPDGDYWVRWVCLCGAQGDKVVNQAEAALDAGYHFMDCH